MFTLVAGIRPETSTLGIGWLAATLLAMLALAYGKRVTGRALANPVLTTEGHVTLIDAFLAAVARWVWLSMRRSGGGGLIRSPDS